MNRQEKIAKLKKAKARQLPETVRDFTILADALEEFVIDFKKSLVDGIGVKDLDLLAHRLEGIGELKSEVAALKEAIANFPALPEEVKIASVNEFLDALRDIKIEQPSIVLPEQKQLPQPPDYTKSVQQVAEAMAILAATIKAKDSKPPSQRAMDWMPYRRVVRKGNTFVFDDVPTAQASGGGGGGVPTQQDTAGRLFIPVKNPDGTSIGGSGGGPATIADGADVAEGSTTDAGVTGDTAGTISAKLRGINTEIGIVTETAPASDTASSGLNGRLQRIAQRLTSLIALLPGSLGQKARAASLAVTLSTEDVTALTPASAITNYANETGGNLATVKTDLDYRFSGGKTVFSSTISASGNTSVITPASGKRIQIYWMSFIPSSDNVNANLVKLGFGTTGGAIATELYRAYAMAHWELFTGTANQSVIINTATAEAVALTVHYLEIT